MQVFDHSNRALQLLEQELPVTAEQCDGGTRQDEIVRRRWVLEHDDRKPCYIPTPHFYEVSPDALEARRARLPQAPDRPDRLACPFSCAPAQPGALPVRILSCLLPRLHLDGQPRLPSNQ